MKGELELPCCYRSRPFYTKSQGQGVSSCLERSGAPPGISRQAHARCCPPSPLPESPGAPPGISGAPCKVWAFPQGFLGAAKKRGITVCSKEMGNHWMHQRKGESCWGLTRMSQARLCNKGASFKVFPGCIRGKTHPLLPLKSV